jgi:endonuclease/exonuclease/phosphatase family metal-dependent hydrolase
MVQNDQRGAKRKIIERCFNRLSQLLDRFRIVNSFVDDYLYKQKMRYLFSLLIAFLLTWSCQQPTEPGTDFIVQKVEKDTTLVIPAGYTFPDGQTYSVLSWNVEHFVDPYDNPYINNDREDNPPSNMDARRSLLLAALRKADADIVILQEFESAKYLAQLAEDSLEDTGYQFFADAPSPDWYMNVAMMSRFPIGIIQGYGNVTTPVSGYLNEEGQKETQNHINTRMWTADVFPSEDYRLSLTGVHLKAGRGPRNIAMRKGQIHFLIRQFEEIIKDDPTANLMMAGDFNALPGSEEMALLLTDSLLSTAFLDPIDSAVNSHPADDPRRRLDYMLVNPNLEQELLPNSTEVKYFFSKDSMRMISDHLPVVGTFFRTDQ